MLRLRQLTNFIVKAVILAGGLGTRISEETINKMMIEYDDDGNEVIDFDEFIKMIVKVEVTNYS